MFNNNGRDILVAGLLTSTRLGSFEKMSVTFWMIYKACASVNRLSRRKWFSRKYRFDFVLPVRKFL